MGRLSADPEKVAWMASSAVSPVLRAEDSDLASSLADENYPVPPDWIIADPEENKRRILAMLEQGERDIAANRGYDLDDVLAELDAT